MTLIHVDNPHLSASAGWAQPALSMERLDEILWMPQDKRGSVTLPQSIRPVPIEVTDITITYDYPLSPVVQDVSLTVSEQGVAVLERPSGAGKSALIPCMAGLMGPLAGRVRIAGMGIQDLATAIRAQLISFVSQRTYFFSNTLRKTILMRREYEDSDLSGALDSALDAVCLANEDEEMPLMFRLNMPSSTSSSGTVSLSSQPRTAPP